MTRGRLAAGASALLVLEGACAIERRALTSAERSVTVEQASQERSIALKKRCSSRGMAKVSSHDEARIRAAALGGDTVQVLYDFGATSRSEGEWTAVSSTRELDIRIWRCGESGWSSTPASGPPEGQGEAP